MPLASGIPFLSSTLRSPVFALAFALLALPCAAQQPKVLAPHKPVAPKIEKRFPLAEPATRQSAVGGLWITGPSMRSSLYLRSDLKTDPLTVTPIIYLSNGVRYSLPPVTIEPAGTVIIDISQGLEAQGVASYAKLYGFAEIEYQWPWAAFCATIKNVDALNSLVYTSNLQQSPDSFPPHPSTTGSEPPFLQTLEGLWWKQEASVSGFIAIGNLGSQPINATVKVTGDSDALLGTYNVVVGSHETKMVDLAEIKLATSSAGGVYVTHDGQAHSVAVNAALYDETSGYSAHLPVFPQSHDPVPDTWRQISNPAYSALGLMNGIADPMMSFPAGTTFTPYSSIRNISEHPVTLTPSLWWMASGGPHSWQSPAFTVPPHRTINLDLPQLLLSAGLKNFSGSFNLVFDTSAPAGDLVLTSGSVDKKNTYVFEVVPRGTAESAAKSLSYWSTGNGDDTMFTVWNPADEPQDFIFTLFYSGGHYLYPVHLNARASLTFNASQVIHNQIPDSEGSLIPGGIHEGSAEISGTEGEQQHILVAIDAGIYNVQKAICIYPCPTCSGITLSSMVDSPFGVPIAAQKKQTFYVQYNTGNQYDMSGSSNWNSSPTNVATVASGGMVTGVAVGSATVSAYTIYYQPIYVPFDCNVTCPAGTFQASSPGTVNPSVAFSGTPVVPLGGTAPITATVTPSSNVATISLALTTTSGTGSASFSSGQTTMNITSTTVLVIKGVQSSSVDNNIQLSASTSAGGVLAVTYLTVGPSGVAVPVNFRQVNVSQLSNGYLQFVYEFDSSSGNIGDLANCSLGEIVTYPGTASPYVWTQPPYTQPNPPFNNPFTTSFSASTAFLPAPYSHAGATDTHSHPAFLTPYKSDYFIAVQYYRFQCTGYKNNAWINMVGPISILRTVGQNGNGTWSYVITKSGSSNSVNPMP